MANVRSKTLRARACCSDARPLAMSFLVSSNNGLLHSISSMAIWAEEAVSKKAGAKAATAAAAATTGTRTLVLVRLADVYLGSDRFILVPQNCSSNAV